MSQAVVNLGGFYCLRNTGGITLKLKHSLE